MADLRDEYETEGIDVASLAGDPMTQFEAWFTDAWDAGVYQANTMVLSTATPDGRPSARAVLMKDVEADGVVFYTNANSQKGQELAVNPYAAATFVWLPLHRQVRIEGPVEEVDASLADAYFESRPYGAQVASAASPQSSVIEDRAALERLVEEVGERFPTEPVERPPHWTGYRIRAERVEFWQGRVHRLHDRIVYEREGEGWRTVRIAP